MLRTINSRLAIHGDNLRNSGAIKKQRPKAFLLLRYITLRPLLWTRYFNNEMQWHVQHDNLVLCLNLTHLRKCKLPGLRGGALLRAPGIFSLSNSFRPYFLCTPGPLSLPLPISFTFLCLLPFNFCKPLPNIFLVFLALLLHLFLVLHSPPPFCNPPCFTLNVVLVLLRLLGV